ncbi:hypothetical protein MP228_003210 [Amoeboaphelidium protococcarum]|nr:hypothetical protein MP228_003210 [Amoeboaphelidium protococcarum]
MTEDNAQQLICDLCAQFYHLGWVTGTGGGMSIRDGDNVHIAPSGVQKERLQAENIFIQSLESGKVLYTPPAGKNGKSLKMSQCTPLFLTCYRERADTYACIHTHSQNAVMATLICEKNNQSELKLSHLEMIKGIRIGDSDKRHCYYDTITIPIIENTAHEEDLTDSLREAIRKYPDTNAVLVRRHGVYVWGKSWEDAKCMAECYDYLFEMFVKMHTMLGYSPNQMFYQEE